MSWIYELLLSGQYIDGSVRNCGISSVSALGMQYSYAMPSLYFPHDFQSMIARPAVRTVRPSVTLVSVSVLANTEAFTVRHVSTLYAIMTSSNGNIFRVTDPLCGEFTGHRWIPRKGLWRGALMFSLICALNKRLSKQSWGRWFEMPTRSLWRHCNVS